MPRKAIARRVVAAAVSAAAITSSIACDHGSATTSSTRRVVGGQTDVRTAPATRRAVTPADAPPGAERPLFERLGGTAGVTKVVDDFVALAAADPKVNFTRKGQPTQWDATPQNVAALKKRLVEFVATTTGGDLAYQGKDMVTTHKGMNVTDAEFDAIAADLKAAMDKHDVAAREQAELLAVVNRTRSAIVPVPARPGASDADPNATNPGDAPKVDRATAKDPEAKPTETPAGFVPQPVTSDETELEEEPAPADNAGAKKPVPPDLNK